MLAKNSFGYWMDKYNQVELIGQLGWDRVGRTAGE